MNPYAHGQQAIAVGMTGSSVLNGAQPAINPSWFNGFDGLEHEATHLLRKVEALADRLSGTVPTADNAATGLRAQPNGIFEEAEAFMTRIRSAIADATAAVERIERKLP